MMIDDDDDDDDDHDNDGDDDEDKDIMMMMMMTMMTMINGDVDAKVMRSLVHESPSSMTLVTRIGAAGSLFAS
jgi:hypothetical protein